jgi:seryl-tRNA synthetase
MKIKKSEIELILLNIAFYKDGKLVGGLLTENCSLSLKRRLDKIRKLLLSKHEELKQDIEEIRKEMEKKGVEKLPKGAVLADYLAEGTEKNKQWLEILKALEPEAKVEFETLLNEEIELQAEPISLEFLDKIETSNNYDFDLLEKISG